MTNHNLSKPTDKVYTFIAPIKPSNFHFVQIDLEPEDLHGRGMAIKKLSEDEMAVMRGLLADCTLEEIRKECDFMHDEIEKLATGLLRKFNVKTYHGLVDAMYRMGFDFGVIHR